jgi:DNA-binding IclR family transcriptional regulator
MGANNTIKLHIMQLRPGEAMESKPSTHAAVEKALRILVAFTPQNERLGTLELSERLGLHKSTVSRLLKVLEKHGFMEQDAETRKYRLGRSAIQIGRAVILSLDTRLVSIARPYIHNLRDQLNEGVGFEVWAGDTTILSYAVEGPQLVRVSAALGERMPLHVAAGAKAIMAYLPSDIVDNLLVGKLRRYTRKTITDPRVLKRRLSDVRRTGVAFDYGEMDTDMQGMAAPVFNYSKRPVAAVVTVGPASRMKSLMGGRAVSLLKDTAERISSLLYYEEEVP